MANIDHYLEDIEVASRGEEVRDSIIDAFEALNSEGPGTMAWNNITGTPDTLTGYGVSDVPASMVSGVLALNNIPPSALERVVPVADDTARFALTSSDVQNGDTVKVLSTMKLYLVVNDTSLSTEAGYEEYRAGTADSVDWSGVLNTPDSLAGYGIEDAYTKTQTDTALAAKSDKATTYTKSDVDAIVNTSDDTSEASNPLVIETDAAQYAKKTHLTLTPVQDLHGYDHPWAGGAGKNLIPMTVDEIKAANTAGTWNGNVYTFNGIVYKILTDSDGNVSGISANGTATANAPFVISPNITFTGNYTISGSPSGGDWSTKYAIGYQRRDNYSVIADGGLGADISGYNGISSSVIIMVRNGYAASNLIFKPMIRLSTDSADFSPYSNICPITGIDNVEVRATGKNLFDINSSILFVGANDYLHINGWNNNTVSRYRYGVSLVNRTGSTIAPNISFKVPKDGTYIISRAHETSRFIIAETEDYAEGSRNTNIFNDVADSATLSLKASKKYVVAAWENSLRDLYIDDIMVRLATDEDSTFEPYVEYTASLDLPEPVYSGTLDLETGELVADMGMVDLGTLTWTASASVAYFYTGLANAKPVENNNSLMIGICSQYKVDTANNAINHVNDKVFALNNANFLIISDSSYTDAATFKTAMNGVQLVYKLATSITYQLTPQQLALFKSINNVSTNAKTVQVTYRNGELATTGNIVDAVEVAKQNAIGESASYTDARLATELAPILGNFATAETSPTSASHAVGEYLLYNKRLYKVLAAISAGQQLTIGTNIGQTNVAAELASQANMISALNSKYLDNAGAHNAIYRGKYLGTSVTEAQWSAISSGAFTDLYIGDYWTINGVNWRIAAFDYWLNCGDTNCTTHHVVIVPDSNLHSAKMNDTNITTGAYLGSDFYTGNNDNTGRADAITKVNNAFGSSHILSHREHMQNATSNGYASGGIWTDATVELMTERMVYGNAFYENVLNGTNFPNSYSVDKSQLPLFAHEPSRITNRGHWWLRSVASSADFSNVTRTGFANSSGASASFGVRPAFGIK